MNFSKLNSVLFRHLLYAPKDIIPDDLGTVQLDAAEEYILDYTNNVIVFRIDGKKYYLKPSELHMSKNEYLERCFDKFFTDICHDEAVRESVKKSLSLKKNRKKIFKMGAKDRRSPLNYYLTMGDAAPLGLPNMKGVHAASLRKFIFYLYGEIDSYKSNCGLGKGRRQTFGAVRSLAVRRLCDELSVDIVPDTRYVSFCGNGKAYCGTLTEDAPGTNICNVPASERMERVTPTLLRALTDLNFIDVLIHDNDHRANNYHVISDADGKYVDVCSYDNDGPTVFMPTPATSVKTAVGYSPLVKRGKINRPHMSRELAENILNFDRRKLTAYRELLSRLQVSCLKRRMKTVQKAIAKTVGSNPLFLIDRDGWKSEHISEELSGKYGKTYLASLINDCYYPAGKHLFDTCELDAEDGDMSVFDNCDFDYGPIDAMIDDMPIALLNKMMSSRFAFMRYAILKKWIAALRRIVPIVKLKLTVSSHIPYMTDSGLICLCIRDLLYPYRLFIALIHESAHILLLTSDGYGELKKAGGMYDRIEYLAELLTLRILFRCRDVAREKVRCKIDLLVPSIESKVLQYKKFGFKN